VRDWNLRLAKDDQILKPKILLIEDNPGDVLLVQEAFQEGRLLYELEVATDGVVAIDRLRQALERGPAFLPDLILLDLNLPKKDGREVLRDIKADPVLCEVPVIVLTTSNDEADVHRAYGLHANCYLTKPLDFDDFIRKMRSIEDFWFTFVRLPKYANQRDSPWV
jgi:chemotaxis family two-component system response regulator Rcp1